MAQLLSAVTPGTLVKLNENGTPVDFYVAKHDYESGLNGAGRTLVVRKEIYQNVQWNSIGTNAYANSTIDTWFNNDYKNLLENWVQEAIETTSFYYTPGNGDNSVTTLARPVFALSLTELGGSNVGANQEGTQLSIYNTLKIANLDGVPSAQISRTPNKNYNDRIFGMSNIGNALSSFSNSSLGARPSFTIPNNLYVEQDGTVTDKPSPFSITAPSIAMQTQPITVSWSSVDGADSYILQRKVDSGSWTPVYAGNDLTFTDTAGSWTTVQYQVCGVFDGTNGAFAQSDPISIIPASVLVISGSDGDLGTVTNDIPYNVASDTGNQISLTRTVNGALVASLTVNSGFAYNIPVMDLPTGTNTIVITATVQASGGPVTVTRTWTYTKVAQTFPGSGGVAQLTQNGQNVFPMTLAEAVKTIGGPWGENMSEALDKLAPLMISGARIATGSYTGTGAYGADNPNVLTVPFPPKSAYVYPINAASPITFSFNFQQKSASVFYNGSYGTIGISFGAFTVEWYSTNPENGPIYQLNVSGNQYGYIIFG